MEVAGDGGDLLRLLHEEQPTPPGLDGDRLIGRLSQRRLKAINGRRRQRRPGRVAAPLRPCGIGEETGALGLTALKAAEYLEAGTLAAVRGALT